MIQDLLHYIPIPAHLEFKKLVSNYDCTITIVNKRSSKHGDFRVNSSLSKPAITLNNSLNPYQFLITAVHELAHLETYLHLKNAKPHGKRWKGNFQKLMLPFVNSSVFPENILRPLARHLINPKATYESDATLSLALKRAFRNSDLKFISEIEQGSIFIFKNKEYIKGAKRRVRYICYCTQNKKQYLFSPQAEIKLKEPYE